MSIFELKRLLGAVLLSVVALSGLAAAQDGEVEMGDDLADVAGDDAGVKDEGERRFKSFAAAAVTFDDNVFSSGNPATDEDDIVVTVLAGGVFTAKVNEGQQKYSAGGQIKLKAYMDNDDLTDYEGDLYGSASFEFNKYNFSVNDRFSRTFEPSDILADRAPRLVNTLVAGFGYDGDRLDIRVGLQHTRRDEEEPQFAALEHVEIRYGIDAMYELSDDMSIGASISFGELDYDFDITADSFEATRISGIVSGRLPGDSGIRYSARLGVILVEDKSALNEDATNMLAAVQANWTSPDKSNQVQISFTSEVYPSTVVSFEMVSRTRLEYRRKFNEKLSGDISISYEDSDRGDLVPDPTRFGWGLGATWKIKKLHAAYISIGQVTKTSRVVNDDYDRMQIALGVNFHF